MADVLHASLHDRDAIAVVSDGLNAAAPEYEVSTARVDGEVTLGSGGVTYHWVVAGRGDVWMPEGTRTQEGDGEALPATYRRLPTPEPVAAALDQLRPGSDDVEPAIHRIIASVVRRTEAGQIGEIRSDLTRIQELWPVVWRDTSDVARSLAVLRRYADDVGVWEQQQEAWEPLEPGDLVVASVDAPQRLRGAMDLWRIEDGGASTFPRTLAVRRLRHLRDTAGGCGPGERAFRRLALPWMPSPSPSRPDGTNRLNSHAVNIVSRLSRTHYHPHPAIGGGAAQWELYVVFAPPAADRLRATSSQLHTFADVSDWQRCTITALRPGDLIAIPPNTAHRGFDVLANVIAIPGFKPSNEIYVDATIAAATNGSGAYNPLFAGNVDPEAMAK